MTGVAQAFVSGVERGLARHAARRRRSSSCRRMPLSDAAFGCPPRDRGRRRRSGIGGQRARTAGCGGGVAQLGRRNADRPAFLGIAGWLADHAVGGVVIFPGAGFVELAIRAGDEVGCTVVDELMLAAPLVIPATGSVSMQVVVGGADESGSRAVSIYSRGDAHSGWTLHAEGVVRPGAVEAGADMSAWPPVGCDTGRHRRAV